MVGTASFALWLKQRRKALDLTQEALAERVGCAVTTIRKLEGGVLRPSKQIAERLADTLDLTPEQHVNFVREARLAASDQPLTPAMPPSGNLPTGTVTFLFTDIEGSTRLWELHPQSMAQDLERHNALMRQACEAYAGWIFKTVGDAVCVAFASARDALAAALAAQRALHAEPWPSLEQMRVRMALHTGEVEARDGDYLGLPLNRTARLVAAAHGSQTLLSRATQELVRDHLPPEIQLRDLGEHRLKDLTRPEHIFQVTAPDLPADFPPLRTLDIHRHNLPAQPNALIGREQEVAQVDALLLKPNVRLVTLTGPGGTGKTRLALQIAAELLDQFADGVWFVPMAAINDPELVLPAVAQTLGIKEVSSQPLLAQLKRYLATKRLLLVLDNFEQVVAAASLVAELLAGVPLIRVLITSRAPLHLYGEHDFPVLPLALPDRHHLPALEQLTQYEAVRLFIERAQAVKPAFAVTNQTAPAVAEICYQLDGLPLAIELAAARIKLFPPKALLTRLERRLTLLTGGARDLPARQQTLWNAIAWSYNLLNDGEQRLFRRLGVFVVGWTLEAAEAVCGSWDSATTPPDPRSQLPTAILDGLVSLIDQSLLRPSEGIEGEPRFTMLETIREFALQQLEQSSEAATLRQRHTDYFLALAESAAAVLTGPHQQSWLNRLEQEHDNLHAAIQSAFDHQQIEMALRFCGALWRFWQFHSHLSLGRSWMERVLAQSRSLESPLCVLVLYGAGWLAHNQGDRRQAQFLFDKSLALAHKLRDPYSIGMALHGVGQIASDQGEIEQARELGEESLRLFRELANTEEIAWSLTQLGAIARAQGDHVQAAMFGAEGLVLFRQIRHTWGTAIALLNLGYTSQAQGDATLAAVRLQEALALFQDLGDTASSAVALASLAEIAMLQDDYTRAAALFRASLTIEREFGNTLTIAWSLADLARVVMLQGQAQQAAWLFGAVESVRDTGEMQLNVPQQADWDRNIAKLRRQMGDTSFAMAWTTGRMLSLDQAIREALVLQ